MMDVRTWARDDSGVTLTELLVSLTVMGLVIGTMYMVLTSMTLMSDEAQAYAVAAREIRLATDVMTRELRQAREISDGEGAFAEVDPRRCSFFMDVEHDGVPERVTYYVSGTQLLRTEAQATIMVPPYDFGTNGPATIIVHNLSPSFTGDIFEYYDSEQPPEEASIIPDVSAVRLHVINRAVSGSKTQEAEVTTWIKVRAVHNSISRLDRWRHHDG